MCVCVGTGEFYPVERELVFDIDLTDYDDVRTCGKEGHICNLCWPLMAVAIQVHTQEPNTQTHTNTHRHHALHTRYAGADQLGLGLAAGTQRAIGGTLEVVHRERERWYTRGGIQRAIGGTRPVGHVGSRNSG